MKFKSKYKYIDTRSNKLSSYLRVPATENTLMKYRSIESEQKQTDFGGEYVFEGGKVGSYLK